MRATALLEAREKADQREIMVADYISRIKDKPSPIRMLKTLPDKDRIAEAVKVNNAEFFAIAANTSAEIITGYQDIVQRMAEVLSQLDQELGCNSAYLLSTREIVAQVVAEARAAIPEKTA